MAYTNSSWTKIILTFTIIFSFIYILIQTLVLTLNKEWLDLAKIYLYLKIEEPKTYILIYSSIVFNTLWMVVSISLLLFVSNPESRKYSIKQTQKLIKYYIAWIISGFLSFISDIVSIIIHGTFWGNYTKSTPTNMNNVINNATSDGALYMMLLSLRFGVILALHIISWIGMIVITLDLQKSLNGGRTKPTIKPSKVPYLGENNADRVRDWYEHYEGDNVNEDNPNYHPETNARHNYYSRSNGNTNSEFENYNFVGTAESHDPETGAFVVQVTGVYSQVWHVQAGREPRVVGT